MEAKRVSSKKRIYLTKWVLFIAVSIMTLQKEKTYLAVLCRMNFR